MSGRIGVVGSNMIDLVTYIDRMPGPGETVVGPRVERFGGGKGANAAVAAARAGADVTLIGAVGDDDTGRAALDELRADGVRVDGVAVLDGVPTGVALIVVDAAGENQIAVGAGANAGVERDRVRDALVDALPHTDCVLVSTEIPLAAVVVACLVVAALRPGPARALSLGTVAGLLFGVTAALVMGVVDLLGDGLLAVLTAGQTWATVACVVAGTLVQQWSYAAGNLSASLPAVTW